jgi:hypothetical protein
MNATQINNRFLSLTDFDMSFLYRVVISVPPDNLIKQKTITPSIGFLFSFLFLYPFFNCVFVLNRHSISLRLRALQIKLLVFIQQFKARFGLGNQKNLGFMTTRYVWQIESLCSLAYFYNRKMKNIRFSMRKLG